MKKEFLKNGIYCLTDGEHRFSVDPLIIAQLSPFADSACDLCSGNGVIAFLLKSQSKAKSVCAVEISENACDLIKAAAEDQRLTDFEIFCGDARDFANTRTEKFSLVTMNPPYYPENGGILPKSAEISGQKFELNGTLFELLFAAYRLTRRNGSAVFSVKPERANEAKQAAKKLGFYIKFEHTVFHDENSKPFLSVFELCKCGCNSQEDKIFLMQNGEYTKFYKNLFETKVKKMSKLYIVGTPIGNLGDFSPRAVETLKSVDFIAAEDTRVTQKLLNFFDIKKPSVSYFEHNKEKKGEYIIERIKNGESCALVTDAGMPAISDPGEELVRQAIENGIETESVPGPTAFATALAISGMPSGRFTFEGFLSQNKVSRREHLESLENEERTMIFYEAPHKLQNTLNDFKKYFGEDRRIAVVREITKIHEETAVCTVGEAILRFEENPPRGEFVLIVGGKRRQERSEMTLEQAVALARDYVKSGKSSSDAAKAAAKISGFKKSDIYSGLLK